MIYSWIPDFCKGLTSVCLGMGVIEFQSIRHINKLLNSPDASTYNYNGLIEWKSSLKCGLVTNIIFYAVFTIIGQYF